MNHYRCEVNNFMEKNADLKFAIGERVRDFRIVNRYTQAQFAEMIDISVNFLSEIENGKKGMSQETICKLCKKFHLSADYILFGNTAADIPASEQLITLANTLSPTDLQLIIEYLNALSKIKQSI